MLRTSQPRAIGGRNDEAKEINEFVDLDKREIGVLAQEVDLLF